MLLVGGRRVLHTDTFIVPDGDDVLIEFPHEGDAARFRIKFTEDAEIKEKIRIDTGPDPEDESRGFITLTNWNRSNRTGNSRPVGVLENETQRITFLATSVYAASKYLVTVQFMLEDIA